MLVAIFIRFKGAEEIDLEIEDLTFGFIRHTHPQTCEGNVPAPLDLDVCRSGH